MPVPKAEQCPLRNGSFPQYGQVDNKTRVPNLSFNATPRTAPNAAGERDWDVTMGCSVAACALYFQGVIRQQTDENGAIRQVASGVAAKCELRGDMNP